MTEILSWLQEDDIIILEKEKEKEEEEKEKEREKGKSQEDIVKDLKMQLKWVQFLCSIIPTASEILNTYVVNLWIAGPWFLSVSHHANSTWYLCDILVATVK